MREILTHLYSNETIDDTLASTSERLVRILRDRGGLLEEGEGHVYYISEDGRSGAVTVSAVVDSERSCAMLALDIRSGQQTGFLRVRPTSGRTQWTLTSTHDGGRLPAPVEAILLGLLPDATETESGLAVRKAADEAGNRWLEVVEPDDVPFRGEGVEESTARLLLTAENALMGHPGVNFGLVAKGWTRRNNDVGRGMGVAHCVTCNGRTWRAPSLPNTLALGQQERARNQHLRELFGGETPPAGDAEAMQCLDRYTSALLEEIAGRSETDVARLKHAVVAGIQRSVLEVERQRRARIEKERDRLERQTARLLDELGKITDERERLTSALEVYPIVKEPESPGDPRDRAIFELAEELRRSKSELAAIRDELESEPMWVPNGGSLDDGSKSTQVPQDFQLFSQLFSRLDFSNCALANPSALEERPLRRIMEALVELDRTNRLEAVGKGMPYDFLERIEGRITYERRIGSDIRIYFRDSERPLRWQILVINPSKTAAGEGVKDKEYARLKRRLAAAP